MSRFALEYDTWKQLYDAVKDADSGDLTGIITPFLAELGPLAPIVAAALAYGGKEFILMIIDGLPHKYPGQWAEPANQGITPKIGLPLTPLLPPMAKRRPEDIIDFKNYIYDPKMRPVIPASFRPHPIEKPVINAAIYKGSDYFLHPKIPYQLQPGNGGPNATYAGIGF
jgi:hypothetical protein